MQTGFDTKQSSSVDADETRHFDSLAAEWWSERGKFAALHAFNPARLAFIIRETSALRTAAQPHAKSLSGLTVLDIGCGGGILSEPLARLGATVRGIDPVAAAIAVAASHASAQGLRIDYTTATAEELVSEGATFDAVIASEVIEHVFAPEAFVRTCATLCKPGGLLVISTLNRTAKSYALAIVAGERILGMIPRGTHKWSKFVKPAELEQWMTGSGLKPVNRCGIVFDPLRGTWELVAGDTSVNYIAAARAGKA